MSHLSVLSNIPFDKKLLPAVGYKKDNFNYRIEFYSDGSYKPITTAGDNDKGKVSIATPYIPTNVSNSAMVGNFKGFYLSSRFPKGSDARSKAFFDHIDWMIDLGIKGLVEVKKTLSSDAFIDYLIASDPDPKKPGETKFLVFLDDEVLTEHDLIKKHWASRRLSLLETTNGICSLTGKQSQHLIKVFPSGIDRPQRMASDCKVASFDKEYTWLQGIKKKDTKNPVDFFESENLLAKTQWLFDYTGPNEPARRIQIDANTHIILISASDDSLALFNAGELVSSYVTADDETDEDEDEDDDDLIDLSQIGKDIDYQNTLAYWRSPLDGKEVKPGNDLVYGLTCKFKQGRFCITDAWQGIPSQVEINYQRFIDSQKATGEVFFYGQKRDVLPIKSLAQVLEPHGVKSQVARIIEKLFRAALYGDKLPLTWLSQVIGRYLIDAKLEKKERESHQEWKLKLINVILENHNMNDTESGAYRLGMGLAGMAAGQNVDECRSMVAKNMSTILRNPSAIVPQLVVRFNSVYAEKVSNPKCFKLIRQIDYIPTSLTNQERGQLIAGYHAGINFIYTKTDSVTESEIKPETEQLNLLGE